jgi:hypothetical protein
MNSLLLNPGEDEIKKQWDDFIKLMQSLQLIPEPVEGNSSEERLSHLIALAKSVLLGKTYGLSSDSNTIYENRSSSGKKGSTRGNMNSGSGRAKINSETQKDNSHVKVSNFNDSESAKLISNFGQLLEDLSHKEICIYY